MTLRRSPLDEQHRALGARMVPFGGWEMPLSYDTGTISEHLACRERATIFDVSHLGTLRVEGPGAAAALQATFTNDLDRIQPGRAQYTHLLDEEGSVLDDIIVWWLEAERFHVMPNASNTARVSEALAAREDVETQDVTESRAVVAVQGPEARELLAPVAPDAATVGRFCVQPFTWEGATCVVAGTGYTGEDGVECAVPADAAGAFWQALVEAGLPPAGLGARDTLRLEAGLPLHGQELGPGITPLQAGLGWVVGWDKGDFPGRAALETERERGVARRLVGLLGEGRRPPRAGQRVLADGDEVGQVTSGNFSPVLRRGIALAFLPPTIEIGEAALIEGRGATIAAEVSPIPFVSRSG